MLGSEYPRQAAGPALAALLFARPPVIRCNTPRQRHRYTSGATPTTYKFTGQRLESMIGGLYDYGARFYDPALGRFISPDTVVPGPGNPQALNRYSYTLNNPLKYTDPSGHRYDPGGAYGRKPPLLPPLPGADAANAVVTWMQNTANDIVTPIENGGRSAAAGAAKVVDETLWWTVPSAVGFRFRLTWGGDAFLGIRQSPVDITAVYNWRSGEFTSFRGHDVGGYAGMINGLSGSVDVGVIGVMGASRNKMLGGPSITASGQVTAGEFVQGGGMVEGGVQMKRDANGNLTVARDPVTGRPVVTGYVGGAISVSEIPSPVSGGLTVSLSETNPFDYYRDWSRFVNW